MQHPRTRWMGTALLAATIASLGVLIGSPSAAHAPVPGISVPLPPPSLTVGAIAQQAGAPAGARIDALVVSMRGGEITWEQFDHLVAGEPVRGVEILRAVDGVAPTITVGALMNGLVAAEAKGKNDGGGTTILFCIGCTIINNPPPPPPPN